MSNLDKARVERLLAELGQYLEERGESAQMYLVGGAAMALAYDRKRLTRDLDAVFIPKEMVYEAARVIAGRHDDLDEGWLNDAVKGLIPPGYDDNQQVVYCAPGLSVAVASPEYMLAMKVHAARAERDGEDIILLAQRLNLTSSEQVLDLAEAIWGPGRLQPKSQFVVQELVDAHFRR